MNDYDEALLRLNDEFPGVDSTKKYTRLLLIEKCVLTGGVMLGILGFTILLLGFVLYFFSL